VTFQSALSPHLERGARRPTAYVHVLEELILSRLPIQSALSPFLSGAWLRITRNMFPK